MKEFVKCYGVKYDLEGRDLGLFRDWVFNRWDDVSKGEMLGMRIVCVYEDDGEVNSVIFVPGSALKISSKKVKMPTQLAMERFRRQYLAIFNVCPEPCRWYVLNQLCY